MQNLELKGDVDVQHPQLSLNSQRLNLAFDPPLPPAAGETPKDGATTKPSRPQPVLRKVTADDAVHCVLIDEDGGARELHGDHLDIETAKDPAGRMYPKLVNATGNVRALDQGQELTAQELALVLAPRKPDPAAAAAAKKNKEPKTDGKAATSVAVELQRMVAKTNVRAVSPDGDVATGDALVVTMGKDGQPQVGLSGKPAKVAGADGSVLTSGQIVIPNRDEAQAVGAGTLAALVENDDPKAPPRLMRALWTGSAAVNMKLKDNHVQVVGGVKTTACSSRSWTSRRRRRGPPPGRRRSPPPSRRRSRPAAARSRGARWT
jgi:hypothetical protein